MTAGRPEPVWLGWPILQAIHFDQILRHGGRHGVRDRGLIESALARPIHRGQDEEADTFELAAAYGFGILKNHGFVDGNKRAAFLAIYTFLGLNGHELDAPEEDAVRVITGLAEGSLAEAELTEWIRSWSVTNP